MLAKTVDVCVVREICFYTEVMLFKDDRMGCGREENFMC